MKKVATVFLRITFILGIVLGALLLITFVASIALAPTIIEAIKDEIVESGQTLNEDDANFGLIFAFVTIAFVILMLVGVCIGMIVVTSITLSRIRTETTRRKMLPLAILNVIFGSTVAAVMLFIMNDRHYKID